MSIRKTALQTTLRTVSNRLSGLIYGNPAYCCLCNTLDTSGSAVCPKCRSELTRQMEYVCKICGIPLRSPLTLCQDCRTNLYYYDMQRSLGVYRGTLKFAIGQMKYYGKRWLSRPLGLLLGETAQPFCHADVVVPVPLGTLSKQMRGYNQAKDLALEVSCKISLPLADILIRDEKQQHQTQLSRKSRWQNLRGTMKTVGNCEVGGSKVLVVDDVTTTGATLDEAARALKSAGAKKVYCVTLARTLRY